METKMQKIPKQEYTAEFKELAVKRVKARTEIGDFNQVMGTNFSDEEFDTVGGLVVNRFGRMPKRGESISFEGLNFQVMRADSRRLHTLLVERVPANED
jgi:magnesium and cobalt transporter